MNKMSESNTKAGAKESPSENGEKDEKPAVAVEPSSEFSDDAYQCDRQYAIVLAQLMSKKYRLKIYKWIERLDTMADCDRRDDRDKYLRYLLLSLSNGKLVAPFNKAPTPGLPSPITIVPKSAIDHVFKKTKVVPADPACDTPVSVGKQKFTTPDAIEPRSFFRRQPVPPKGGIVYAAAFSTK